MFHIGFAIRKCKKLHPGCPGWKEIMVPRSETGGLPDSVSRFVIEVDRGALICGTVELVDYIIRLYETLRVKMTVTTSTDSALIMAENCVILSRKKT